MGLIVRSTTILEQMFDNKIWSVKAKSSFLNSRQVLVNNQHMPKKITYLKVSLILLCSKYLFL